MGTDTEIVVALEDGPEAASVLAVAQELVRTLDQGIRVLHVTARADAAPTDLTDLVGAAGLELEVVEGDVVAQLAAFLERPATAAMVVGSRSLAEGPRPAGHVPLALIERTAQPVVVVPPDADPGRIVREVLLPLDGSEDVTIAAELTVRLLRGSGARITIVHVFDPQHVPSFLDQPHHALAAWGQEFLDRHAQDGARLALRAGDAGDGVLDVVAAADADLVVLCWHRDLSAGRAQTVNELLSSSRVPLLLLPVQDAASGHDPERGHDTDWQVHSGSPSGCG